MITRILATSVLLAVASGAQAQFPYRPGCGCQAQAVPIYSAPQPVVQQMYRPVYETQYRQQQVMTYQDVVRTQVRREQQVVSVPVTTTRQVTVDAGSYQMVWVPKVETRNIQETVVQQQVQYRDVPYQVVERIPQMQTQVIPQQTVRYVPEYRTVYMNSGAIYGTAAVPTPVVAAEPTAASTAASAPQTAAAAPQTSVAQPETAPAAQTAQGKWKQIPQRQAANPEIQMQSFEVSAEPTPQNFIAPVRNSIPTAARAWQSGLIR